MGMPGAGKGTQADRIATSYQIPHISTGDILCSFVQNKNPIGLETKTFMEKGELVPDNLMNELLWDRLGEEDTKNGFVLDGYPRTVQQAEAVEAYLHSQGMQLDAVLYLAVGKGVVRRRLAKRLQSPFLFPNATKEWGGFFTSHR
ncbi:nucleoside monophosphate kinase [Jeotgalibaca caeni]|uniref:nucleoside monophosphate kinase n=1 Tax=Jeotgalibaca caeni TaxID=3028623 RepID=UPI00237DF608|nr:nucleoside monophosphate kinase [Jeotgalibaca caeni]MDE1549673.1 nucleoside monophosphate kinase [Jeotgalibaca caeni]